MVDSIFANKLTVPNWFSMILLLFNCFWFDWYVLLFEVINEGSELMQLGNQLFNFWIHLFYRSFYNYLFHVWINLLFSFHYLWKIGKLFLCLSYQSNLKIELLSLSADFICILILNKFDCLIYDFNQIVINKHCVLVSLS